MLLQIISFQIESLFNNSQPAGTFRVTLVLETNDFAPLYTIQMASAVQEAIRGGFDNFIILGLSQCHQVIAEPCCEFGVKKIHFYLSIQYHSTVDIRQLLIATISQQITNAHLIKAIC